MPLEIITANHDLVVRHEAIRENIAASVIDEIDLVWREQKRLNPGLFNGKIFNVEHFGPDEIRGHFIEYKRFLAQLCKPELRNELDVMALAVSGLIWLDQKIVLGRRSANVTQDPGRWELCPSGGVTPRFAKTDGTIDYRAQLLEELFEELKADRQYVKRADPFALVYDGEKQVLDIAVELICDGARYLSNRDVHFKPDGEYDQIEMVDMGQLDYFIDGVKDNFVEVSLCLLKKCGLYH